DLPFEKLIEELHPDRNQSYAALFNVMFVFQNAPTSTLELPGLDLSVSVSETKQGVAVAMSYNTDLFNHQTIVQMLRRFETLLENIVRAPANKISTFSIVSTEEKEKLTNDFNDPL